MSSSNSVASQKVWLRESIKDKVKLPKKKRFLNKKNNCLKKSKIARTKMKVFLGCKGHYLFRENLKKKNYFGGGGLTPICNLKNF